MTNIYKELQTKQMDELNNFKQFFAFDKKQFDEGMKKLGLEADQKEEICSTGYGGFILNSDVTSYKDLFKKHDEEMKEAIKNSDKFIFDMFNYELANHEYLYTYSVDDTLRALGLTYEEVEADERLLKGLKEAKKYQQDNDNNNY